MGEHYGTVEVQLVLHRRDKGRLGGQRSQPPGRAGARRIQFVWVRDLKTPNRQSTSGPPSAARGYSSSFLPPTLQLPPTYLALHVLPEHTVVLEPRPRSNLGVPSDNAHVNLRGGWVRRGAWGRATRQCSCQSERGGWEREEQAGEKQSRCITSGGGMPCSRSPASHTHYCPLIAQRSRPLPPILTPLCAS